MTEENEKKREEFKSKKSESVFIVEGTKNRAFLYVTGEASLKRDVRKETDRIRIQGAGWYEAIAIAKQLSATY